MQAKEKGERYISSSTEIEQRELADFYRQQFKEKIAQWLRRWLVIESRN